VPLTIAHPIAAIPLRHPLGRLGVLAALVIGSITPDLPLFLPLPISRNTSHSMLGLLFCLPAGVLGYLLYDYVLDRPLRALMPEGMQRRLVRVGRDARPPVWSPAVLVSLLVGAVTHITWDSFTHGGAAGVGGWLPVIETRLAVGPYRIFVFTLLQHLSSVVGMGVLMVWIWRWYRRAPQADAPAGGVGPAARRTLLVAIAVAVVVAAALGATRRPMREASLRALPPVARRAAVGGLSTLVGAVTVYAVAWHWIRSRRAGL
jgi:hypothetical protein